MLWGVIGSTGMLGSDLMSQLRRSGQTAIGFNRSNLDFSKSPAELSADILYQGQPDVLVNATGYTDVDNAESDADQAHEVNAEYPRKLSLAAKELGARFIQISTDYVFDGFSITPYKTTDTPNPQSVYSRSKLAGEVAVQESGADYQIIRTAWLYGANGNCFPRTVARLLKEEGRIKVVSDQIGQPTWTKDLAELIIDHQNTDASLRPRIVHATASGSCSWYEFACEISLSIGYDPEKTITQILTAEYQAPTKRPSFSVLDNQNETGLVIGDWRERWQEAAGLVLGE